MKTYDIEKLIRMWETEDLTNEQAIGQMLLKLRSIDMRVGLLEGIVHELRRTNDKNKRMRS